ncbi:MAG TPA: DUF6526 family protein [Pedobacter sp.]|nr:DUF6526 family protein [Pedobacter sp.]
MQNYKNHSRYYIPHHFVFYPLLIILIVYCIREALKTENDANIWAIAAIGFFMVGWLSFMLRQHYGMTLQNRLVVQEMRFRYYVLTAERFEPLEDRLRFGQIAALRFASDAELPGLVQRTLNEGLESGDIKSAIKFWKPDHSRI